MRQVIVQFILSPAYDSNRYCGKRLNDTTLLTPRQAAYDILCEMKSNKQSLVSYVMTDTGTVPLTLADINEGELTDEQKKIVSQFENLAEAYLRKVEKLNSSLVIDYKKFLKKHKDVDEVIVQILNETLHQLT